ncbi:forkhead box protein [Aureisphaera sp.]
MRKIVLIILSIIGIMYCFRFGKIWTSNIHGGQLSGIPFTALIIVMTISFFLATKTTTKRKIFSGTCFIFMALTGFSLTVEFIRSNMKDYFKFLYHEPEGWVNEILLGWILVGIILYFGNEYFRKKSMNK